MNMRIFIPVLTLLLGFNQAALGMDCSETIIVNYKSTDTPIDINDDWTLVRRLAGGAHVYRSHAPTVTARQQAIEILQSRPDIHSIECNQRRYPLLTTNDSFFVSGEQWYLLNTPGGTGAEIAWDTTTGDATTVIAVIDTGILPHPELSRILPGYDFISADSPGDFSSANDGDGRDSDPADAGDWVVAGECGPGSAAKPSSWHGTIISSLLVADTNNNSGIAAIDHQAMVLPIRVLGKCGGFISDINDAIRWAAGLSVPGVPDNPTPADIINLSFGAESSCSAAEQSAIDAAVENNAVVVVAAGNEGSAENNLAPANCNNVITVASSSRQGGRTSYTNFGPQIHLSAPGGNDNLLQNPANGIVTALNNGTTVPMAPVFGAVSGSSFAAPMISGAAALLKSLNTDYTPNHIVGLLMHSAKDFPTNTTDATADCQIGDCGVGLLDMAAAVQLAQNSGTDDAVTPFTFNSISNAARGTIITSAPMTVSGIDIPILIRITGGEYAIDGDDFTEHTGTVINGQTVTVRVITSSEFITQTQATLTVGNQTAIFNVTTEDSPNNAGSGSLSWLLLLPLLLILLLKHYGPKNTFAARQAQPGVVST